MKRRGVIALALAAFVLGGHAAALAQCTTDGQCIDANLCNGTERCLGGTCQPGTPLNCDDENICTSDSCSPSAGCQHLNNTASCDDFNSCTTLDRCAGGVCTGSVPRNCDEGNPCTTDTCDPGVGCVRTNNNNPCSDGNLCNGAEVCSGGSCQEGTPLTCNDNNPCTDDSCNSATGCVFANDDTNSCSDGNLCNGAETCASGVCQPGTSLVCNDDNPCTDDGCTPSGGCNFTNDDSNSCADADLCNGNETCVAGSCQPGASLVCDDSNLCTDDSCEAASGCTYVDDDTNSCDDANVCNGAESCVGGTCQGGIPLTCNDNNPCTDDACDPIAGCTFTNDDTNACADSDACNGGETCSGGSCQPGSPPVCEDNNPCTDDSCDPVAGCVNQNDDSNSCDDGSVCNGAELCAGGSCQAGTPLTCNDQNPCTDDSCDPIAGCQYVNDDSNSCSNADACDGLETCSSGSCLPGQPPVCNDQNPCTDDSCDAASGCVFTNDDANSCDDANACNGVESCAAGTCQAGAPPTCNDNNPCTDDSCDAVAGCVYTNDDANSCDDGNVCNGAETCSAGQCQAGSPLTCNDNNPCTDDFCNSASGCVFTNDNTNVCGDGDFCNGAESCNAGICQTGVPPTCNDSNPCTDDSCDAATGCRFVNDNTNSCNDSSVCNGAETCVAGACQPGNALNCDDLNPCTDDTCDPLAGCRNVNDNSNNCGDGNACNGAESCVNGACRGGTPLVCNDSNPCTDDSCDPAAGCVFTNDDTNSCADANVCNGAETCVQGVCQPGSSLVCNDDNPCTDDMCNPASGCSFVNDDTNSCGDGNACNGLETCLAGSCQPGAPPTCNDNNPCTDDSCDPLAGCVFTHDNTNVCGDGNVCNGAETCVAGVCQTGAPPACNDNNPCTDDSCDPASGCVVTNDNTNSCSDGNACNGTERCISGVCQPGLVPLCNDGNPCTDDSCDPALGCTSMQDDTNSCSDNNVCNGVEVCQGGTCRAGTPLTCNDGNLCTDDSCNPASGCAFANDDSNACGDGNACNGADSCVAGACQTAPPPTCNDNNPCTDDACNPATGCVYTNDNTNSCDDGSVCTGIETCVSGVCQPGTPLTCNDNNPCTDDTCHAVSGCMFANDNTNSCSDGLICTSNDFCSAGVCISGPPPNCDDNKPCTDDSCDEVFGCRNIPDDSNTCGDGNDCNGADRCQAGTCHPGAPLVCNDNNPCTDDACDPVAGCLFTNDNTNSCSDGLICTSNDFCSAGVCVGGPPPNCNDNKLCTDDSCDEAFGCRNIPDDSNSCSDNNACNGQELCQGGTCLQGIPLLCNDNNPCTDDSCSQATGCRNVIDDTNSCSDGSVCTGAETCAAGVCVQGPPPNCNDNNPCTDDTCHPATGCAHANNQVPCDDGLFCTQTDVCSGGQCVGGGSPCGTLLCDEQNDLCGKCLGDAECDDQNPCTDDRCNLGTCAYVNNANPCDDGSFCTPTDACFGGLCVGAGDACPGQVCDAAGERCVECLTQAHCDDGLFCNGLETCNAAAGTCSAGLPVDCPAQTPQQPHCDESSDACVQCLNDGHCTDGLFCTGAETCNTATGQCMQEPPVDCAALNPARPFCDEALDQCVQCTQVAHCNDANVCTTDGCSAGNCTHSFNGLSCNDGLFCTLTDACSGGVCVGSGNRCPGKTCHEDLDLCGDCQAQADCNDNNACTNDVCLNFTCRHNLVTGPCDDGKFCTLTDICASGSCVGFGARCPDGVCDEANDQCLGCFTDPDCDDANDCTVDHCVNTACTYDPQPGSCNDGNWCTVVDTCDGMTCTGNGERCPGLVCDSVNHICGECFAGGDCDDANPCTADSCIGEQCAYANLAGPCDDGHFCTGSDTCVDGACVGGPDPCEGLGQCDETLDSCGGCFPPAVTAIGSRFLAVHPVNPDAHPVALRVQGDGTDSAVACVTLYVQSQCAGGLDDGEVCGLDADCRRACAGGTEAGSLCVTSDDCPGGRCEGQCHKGRLGLAPTFLPASQWGTVLLGDGEITPDSLYWVTMICEFGPGPMDSQPAAAVTWRRGDADGDAQADAVDIGYIADVISQRIYGDLAVCSANLWDCLLDDVVNAMDIAEVTNVMADEPSQCASPCPE